MSIVYGLTIATDCHRSGHAAAFSTFSDSLFMFGGWPRSEDLETVATTEANGCPLYRLSRSEMEDAIRRYESHKRGGGAQLNESPTILRWDRWVAGVMPRTRHGHHLVAVGSELYLIGGSYWAHGDALATQDMVFDIPERRWYALDPVCPPRFCAAMAKAPNPPDANSEVLYVFGGLGPSRDPTNTLFRICLPHRACEELITIGSVPQPQFKSVLVADTIHEPFPVVLPDARGGGSVNDRPRRSGRLFHADGFLPDTARVKKLHMLDVSTGVWREICHAPDLVRSQILHVEYRVASEAMHKTAWGTEPMTTPHSASMAAARRLEFFTMFGGMPSRKGRRFRCSSVVTFDAQPLMWTRAKAEQAPVAGVTAHVTVPFEGPSGISGGDVVALSVCGNVDGGGWGGGISTSDDESGATIRENSLGEQTHHIHVFVRRPASLKEIVVRQIHRFRMPCHAMHVADVERDELLDELF